MSWIVEVRKRDRRTYKLGPVYDRIECHTAEDANAQRDGINAIFEGSREARVVPDPETRRRARRAIATAVTA